MKLLAFCLLLGMSAQAQNIPWATTEGVTSCYARYSGLCQTSPLTAAEKAADEVEKQIDGLLLELGDRRDLSAADVLYIGDITRRRMFTGGEELLKNLQQIKKRAERAAQRAADETDGKPQIWSWPDGKILWIDPKVDPHKPWDEVDGMDWPRKSVPADPVDVPAVLHGDTRMFYCGEGIMRCDHGEHVGNAYGACPWDAYARKLESSCGRTHYTCADKSRILLTSEDGKKHCIKFQEAQ